MRMSNDLVSTEHGVDIAKEYQDFAYIVSHDLNAPMRHIRQFTGLLLDGCDQTKLNADQVQCVDFIYMALDKVEAMQAALLEFSRLNTRLSPFGRVDVAVIVDRVVQSLWGANTAFEVDFSCDEMPAVWGDEERIARLFYCLLENAMKFHPVIQDTRAISLSVYFDDGRWHFSIKDNGIGLKPEQCERVLTMFKRLRPDDYAGIGAGLTLADKIVRMHGGCLHIKPREHNIGAEVVFSLPEAVD